MLRFFDDKLLKKEIDPTKLKLPPVFAGSKMTKVVYIRNDHSKARVAHLEFKCEDNDIRFIFDSLAIEKGQVKELVIEVTPPSTRLDPILAAFDYNITWEAS